MIKNVDTLVYTTYVHIKNMLRRPVLASLCGVKTHAQYGTHWQPVATVCLLIDY